MTDLYGVLRGSVHNSFAFFDAAVLCTGGLPEAEYYWLSPYLITPPNRPVFGTKEEMSLYKSWPLPSKLVAKDDLLVMIAAERLTND